MKVLSVVGARPQFVKLAPVHEALNDAGAEHVVVHTGQHYDPAMSDDFFASLVIPAPRHNLEVGSDSHGVQTGAMMTRLDPLLAQEAPDWVIVYGDTNSTLAGALCAVKQHLKLAHVEAGLRSFNRRMPEEHNRILTDHAADVCLAPTALAMENLDREGLAARSLQVGDVMVDVLNRVAAEVEASPVSSPLPTRGDFALATIHRADNTDSRDRLASILDALGRLPLPVYIAAHPRLRARCAEFGLAPGGSVKFVPPLRYPQLVQGLASACAVITDSGGLQKEAYLMNVPTVTVRSETEWPETLADSWNVLVEDPRDIAAAATRPRPAPRSEEPYGLGDAAPRVVAALLDRQHAS